MSENDGNIKSQPEPKRTPQQPREIPFSQPPPERQDRSQPQPDRNPSQIKPEQK